MFLAGYPDTAAEGRDPQYRASSKNDDPLFGFLLQYGALDLGKRPEVRRAPNNMKTRILSQTRKLGPSNTREMKRSIPGSNEAKFSYEMERLAMR